MSITKRGHYANEAKPHIDTGCTIPGSHLYRAYCRWCDTAIRIRDPKDWKVAECEHCGFFHVGNPHPQKHEPDPWQENAIRWLEDGQS